LIKSKSPAQCWGFFLGSSYVLQYKIEWKFCFCFFGRPRFYDFFLAWAGFLAGFLPGFVPSSFALRLPTPSWTCPSPADARPFPVARASLARDLAPLARSLPRDLASSTSPAPSSLPFWRTSSPFLTMASRFFGSRRTSVAAAPTAPTAPAASVFKIFFFSIVFPPWVFVRKKTWILKKFIFVL